MKLAALFSGGKDSTLAVQVAKDAGHEVSCLVVLKSDNPDSFMFHTPNIEWTELQARMMSIPYLEQSTKGEKERELKDLAEALKRAREHYGIKGVITGAVRSAYQNSRVQRVCDDLKLWCFSPLWLFDQEALLQTLLEKKFEVIISGIAAYPLDESWLGRKLDRKTIKDIKALKKSVGFNPAGEGGEYETFVLNAPLFSKALSVVKSSTTYENHAGVFRLEVLE